MKCNRQNFFVILGHFFPFHPPNSPKNENFKKQKKCPKISSFYTSIPKIMIIGYTVPEIWHVTDVFFILGNFLPFYPIKSPKKKIFLKWKKNS